MFVVGEPGELSNAREGGRGKGKGKVFCVSEFIPMARNKCFDGFHIKIPVAFPLFKSQASEGLRERKSGG